MNWIQADRTFPYRGAMLTMSRREAKLDGEILGILGSGPDTPERALETAKLLEDLIVSQRPDLAGIQVVGIKCCNELGRWEVFAEHASLPPLVAALHCVEVPLIPRDDQSFFAGEAKS